MSKRRAILLLVVLGATLNPSHAQGVKRVELHTPPVDGTERRGVFFAGGGAGGGPDNSQLVFTMGGHSLNHSHLGALLETGAVHYAKDPGVHGFFSFNAMAGWQPSPKRDDVVFVTSGLTVSGGPVGFINFGAGYDLHIGKNEGAAVRFEVRDYTSGSNHSPTFRILWLGHFVDPVSKKN